MRRACRAVYYGAILNSITRLMMHDMHLLFLIRVKLRR